MLSELADSEALERAYRRLRAAVEAELIDEVRVVAPAFFKELVIDLLVKMGYGGNRAEAARAIGRTGDGVIDEEEFGKSRVRATSSPPNPPSQRAVSDYGTTTGFPSASNTSTVPNLDRMSRIFVASPTATISSRDASQYFFAAACACAGVTADTRAGYVSK